MHGSNTRHTDWGRQIPQGRDVMVFFLKALCLQQGGKFNEVMVECECDQNGHLMDYIAFPLNQH